MPRFGIQVGDLVTLNPSYTSGVWLRSSRDSWVTGEAGHVAPKEVVVVIELDDPASRDPGVLVVSSAGKIGWTFASRLNDT